MTILNSRDQKLQDINEIYPRLLSQTYNALDLSITLENTEIVVNLVLPEAKDTPKYVSGYIIKLWRQGETVGTSATDWWSTPFDTNNMLEQKAVSSARFNILSLPLSSTLKRISENGINYQIACRSTDKMENTSSRSILGSIRIKTISVL